MSGRGPALRATGPSSAGVDRGRLQVTRLRVVLAATLALALVQLTYEEVLLFVATTGYGPDGLTARPVALAVPVAVALSLLLLLVGGALWAGRRHEHERARVALDDERDEQD